MKVINSARPSPAMVVAVLALVFAVVGSAVAASDSLSGKITKSKVKSIANKQITKAAPNLSVNKAKTADSAPPSGPAGNGLTGNYPNPAIAADAVKAANIADDAVGAAEIAANAVGTTEIANDAVTSAKIAANAVGSSEIADGSVGSAEVGTITEIDAVSASIPNGSFGSVTANCPAGQQVLSGGNDGFLSNGYFVVASRASGSSGWTVFLVNQTGGATTITAHAYCLTP
jgi:hypothetical protein